MLVALDQIVGNHQDRSPQVVVGTPHQRTVWAIDLVALIPRRVQAGSAGNGSGLDVMPDRSHLARKFSRRDDVDSWNTQKQDVGGLTQGFRQFFLDCSDRLQPSQPIGVEIDEEPAME